MPLIPYYFPCRAVLKKLLWLLIAGVSPFNGQAQPLKLPHSEIIADQQGLPQAFVPAIVQDRQGFIWLATRDGLCRYDGRQFKIFQPASKKNGLSSISSSGLTALFRDKQGALWMTTEQDDLDRLDPKTEAVTHISRQPLLRKLLANHKLGPILIDQQQRLWLTLGAKGLCYVDFTKNQIHPLHLLNQQEVRFLAEGPDGRIWFIMNNTLAYFDEHKQVIQPLSVVPLFSSEMGGIGGLFVRPNGDILLAFKRHLAIVDPKTATTRLYLLPTTGNEWGRVNFAIDQQGGIYFDQNTVLFRFTDQDGPTVLEQDLNKGNQCASLFVDATNVLWMGTDGAGIRKYDLRTTPFQAATYRRSFRFDLVTEGWLGLPTSAFPNVSELANLDNYHFRSTIDRQASIWYSLGGTTINRVNALANRVEQMQLPVPGQPQEKRPCPLATDPDGHVWALYDSRAWWFNTSQKKWIAFPYPIPRQHTGQVQLMVVDKQFLWLATELNGLFRLNRTTGQLRQYSHQETDSTSLSNNMLFSLSADPLHPNRLWIGTFGSGVCVFDKGSGRSRRLTTANGLPNQVIYSLIPDKQGFIWMGTNKGLCRLNTRTFATQTYTQQDGLQANEFNRFHYLQRPDGLILMGGLTGITAFYPNQIRADTCRPRTEITSLQINNKLIEPGENSPLGWLPIQALTQLTLPHDQNFLNFTFAALQFNKPEKNRYRYQLDGLAPHWVESAQPLAVYTGLRPGIYTLRLNATNTSGSWSPYVRTLTITILPPRWATWWAYALYVLLVSGLAFIGIREYVNRLRLRQAVVLQQKEIELTQRETAQLKAVDEMKTRFFANITHDFRTPLTLILSPTQQLLTEVQHDHQRRSLSLIEANAHQLLQLINQLMDLAKLEASAMTVQESAGDLSACFENWIGLFAEQAAGRHIQLAFLNHLTGAYRFDVSKLERIVYNLLSNALKFTPNGGRITIILEPMTRNNQTGVSMSIADSGIGIAADHLPHIFDRFYQIDPVASRLLGNSVDQQYGTGIGLALVKELVDVQGGQIQVESQLQVGTTFTVWLPYRLIEAGHPALQPADSSPSGNSLAAGLVNSILLVEDHNELADLITQSLPASYQIHRASNGAIGLDMAFNLIPDLLISDVLMPELDGYTLCRMLKNDQRTNHIPVLLLTAKSSVESRLEGLSQGADDYITKPFLVSELQLRVQNLLDNRRRLRERIQAELTQPSPFPAQPTPADEDSFLTQLYALLEANLDNSAFGVDELVTQMAMSRTGLYRKVKALTGIATSDVIRLYRLKRATYYLQQGYPVADTAYRVGFESPSHFTKVFRDQYQMTPTQFMANA